MSTIIQADTEAPTQSDTEAQPVLVSVLLTNYNNSKYLTQAIQSVLDQTHTHWELVAVDDASTDSSMSILQDFAQNHANIHVFQNPMNFGAYYTLNECLRRASGDYFVKLDSDDYYHEDKLKIQLEECETNEVGACCCRVLRVHPEKRSMKQLIDPSSTIMFSRDIFLKYGYFDNCRFDCDVEFIQRLSRHMRIPVLRHILDYKYNIPTSLTQCEDSGVLKKGKSIRKNYKSNAFKYNPVYMQHPRYTRDAFTLHPYQASPIEIHFTGDATVTSEQNSPTLSIHCRDSIVLGKVVYKVHPESECIYTLHNPQHFMVNIRNCCSILFYFTNYSTEQEICFVPNQKYLEVHIIFCQGFVEYTPLLLTKKPKP